MMQNQHNFVATIKTALGRTTSVGSFSDHFPGSGAIPDTADNITPSLSSEQREELIEIFAYNCALLNTNLYRVHSYEQATHAVVKLIRESQVEFGHNRHVIQHDHPDIAALELWKNLPEESVTLHTSFAGDTQLREKTIASFIGITAPEMAVAESGTLIELTTPGRPRSTSLVPSIHIAILSADRLVATLEQAYIFLQKQVLPDNLVFISGPSKTADIEAHLVHGAHGPCELHVVIIVK